MSSKQKADIKIGVWKSEKEEHEKELRNINEQISLWKGYEKGCQESLDLLNLYFKKIKLSMQWEKLTKKEKEKYTKLASDWPGLKKEEQIKEYKIIIENWDELSEKDKKEKLSKTPIPVSNLEMLESEGAKAAEIFRPYQSSLFLKIKHGILEPERRMAQATVIGKNISRLEKLIVNEAAKDFSEEFSDDDDDD